MAAKKADQPIQLVGCKTRTVPDLTDNDSPSRTFQSHDRAGEPVTYMVTAEVQKQLLAYEDGEMFAVPKPPASQSAAPKSQADKPGPLPGAG